MYFPYLLVLCMSLPMLVLCENSGKDRPFTPTKYLLEIKTDLYQKCFNGKVTITVKCEEKTNAIFLNALETKLTIDEFNVLVYREGQSTNLLDIAHWVTSTDMFKIGTTEELKKGETYTVTVPFQGKMENDPQEGYYVIQDGKEYIAANQFNNLQARSGFPCFDDGVTKATFEVVLHRRRDEKSLSSMPLKKTITSNEPGWETDEYEPSIPLPPHLIAYVVTNIPIAPAVTRDCTKRIHYWFKESSEDSTKSGYFACGQALHQSAILEKEFGLAPIDNTNSKIDVFVHPKFPYTVVGGWGLVMSREIPVTQLIGSISENFSTFVRLVFQYFGGVVSSDSTKSFVFFRSLNNFISETLLDNGVFSFAFERLLLVDRPMLTNQFTKEFDIREKSLSTSVLKTVENWDSDNYNYYIDSKGVLLIRMIYYTVGEKAFKTSLRMFYEKYKYKSASEDDFWEIVNLNSKNFFEKIMSPLKEKVENSDWFKKTSFIPLSCKNYLAQGCAPLSNLPLGVSIKRVVATWTKIDGNNEVDFDYPLIRVKREWRLTFTVTQERFEGNWVKRKERDLKNEEEKLWWIPLTYTNARKPNFQLEGSIVPNPWIGPMHGNKGIRVYTFTRDQDWIIFNIQSVGLYRVMYEESNWDKIIKVLNDEQGFTIIHYLNRAQLVRDSVDFGFLGDLPYDYVFRLLRYLQFEDNPVVWKVFFEHTRNLETAIKETEHYGKYEESMRKLLGALFDRTFTSKEWIDIFNTPYSSDAESVEASFKLIVLKKSLAFRVDNLINVCQKEFAQWKASGNLPNYYNKFQKDLIATTISAALLDGNSQDFQFVFQKLTKSSNNDDNFDLYVAALEYTKNEESISDAVNFVFTKDPTTIQLDLIRSLLKQPKSFTLALDYVDKNFPKVKASIINDNELLELIRIFTLGRSTSQLNQVQNLIGKKEQLKNHKGIKTILEQAKLSDEWRQKWLEENKESLEKGLKAWEFDV